MKTVKKNLMTKVIFLFVLFCATTTFIYSFSGLPWPANTHGKITDYAIENVRISQSSYPDIYRFEDEIIEGSNCEPHNPPGVPGVPCDNDYHLWWPVYENWFSYGTNDSKDAYNKASAKYWYCQEYSFTNAYTDIGHMMHNVQDTSVPSHINQCIHGTSHFDGLEVYAILNHGYDFTHVDQSFNQLGQSWNFWLPDTGDDDDEDDSPDSTSGGGINDDDGDSETCWGIPIDEFGSYGWGVEIIYGQYGAYPEIVDTLPGLNKGRDAFYDNYSGSDSSSKWTNITNEVLYNALVDTVAKLKEKSEALPPIIPNSVPYSVPSVSQPLFGPNMSVSISFTALENRRGLIRVYIKAGTVAIKDIYNYSWNGYYVSLDYNSTDNHLPYEETITVEWLGQLASGSLNDGQHTLKMKIQDYDDNYSSERTLSVKYDKTKPTGNITVTGIN